jgi:glycine cleavage system transcriptional repressor
MTTLGSEFAIMLLVEGTWGSIAKIETSMPSIEKKLGLVTNVRRTTPRESGQENHYLFRACSHRGSRRDHQ